MQSSCVLNDSLSRQIVFPDFTNEKAESQLYLDRGTKSRYWNPVLSNLRIGGPHHHTTLPLSSHSSDLWGNKKGLPHLQSDLSLLLMVKNFSHQSPSQGETSGVSRSKAWVSSSTSYPSTSSDFLVFNSFVSARTVFHEREPWAPGWTRVGEGDPWSSEEATDLGSCSSHSQAPRGRTPILQKRVIRSLTLLPRTWGSAAADSF